jgi:alkylation response protein AidB-like acyl-CoA dehydrogenase
VTLASSLLLDEAGLARCRDFFEPRAAAADRGDTDFCEAAVFLGQNLLGAAAGPLEDPNRDLELVARTLASVAWFDMGTAFSLWCQQMVLEYLAKAPAGMPAREQALPAVREGQRVGTSAMAGPMAHFVSEAPLTLNATPAGDGGYTVSGAVPWASNLAPGRSMIVSVAARETGGPLVFAVPIEAPGITIGSFASLIGMQGTLSASLTFEDVSVPQGWVISEDFRGFIGGIRPVFLLLQSAYCWGLAARSVVESEASLRGVGQVFRDEVANARARVETQAAELRDAARTRCREAAVPHLLDLRIEAARLATECTSLESRVVGGRSYVASCDTARRLREALFLPIQAPTEGQLRWERSQFA